MTIIDTTDRVHEDTTSLEDSVLHVTNTNINPAQDGLKPNENSSKIITSTHHDIHQQSSEKHNMNNDTSVILSIDTSQTMPLSASLSSSTSPSATAPFATVPLSPCKPIEKKVEQHQQTPPQHKKDCTVRSLKLTILNVRGIKVRTKLDTQKMPSTHNLAITAAVSFSGSCDPQDMYVLGSGFCSVSQRVFVESKPIIVPFGKADTLTASWIDNVKVSLSQDSTSNISCGRGGCAVSKMVALPHLYVCLQDSNNLNKKSTIGGQAPSQIEIIDEDNILMDIDSNDDQHNMKKISDEMESDNNLEEKEFEQDGKKQVQTYSPSKQSTNVSTLSPSVYSNSSEIPVYEGTDASSGTGSSDEKLNLRSPSVDQTQNPPSINRICKPSSSSADLFLSAIDTIINTPSEAALETAVPEILEFNVSLNIQLDSNTESNVEEKIRSFEEAFIHVKSLCSLAADGGDGLAHLVLFPDIMRNPSSSSPSSKISNGRIIELPLRRKNIPLNRSGVSSVSGLTSHCQSTVSSNHRFSEVIGMRLLSNNDPDAWVDLEEDATMTVQLQECNEEEGVALDAGKRIVFDHHLSESMVLHNTDHGDQVICVEKTDDNGVRHMEVTPKSSGNRIVYRKDDFGNAPHEPNVDMSLIAEEEEAPLNTNHKHGLENSMLSDISDTHVQEMGYGLCDVFRVENLVNMVTGILTKCTEETDLYHPNVNVSMDSTIQSMY